MKTILNSQSFQRHIKAAILSIGLIIAMHGLTAQTSVGNGNSMVINEKESMTEYNRTAIFIPNSFTPNGDGKNDEFMFSSDVVKKFSMQIFDEKGAEVFATTFMNNGWDGEYHGRELKQSVYLYRIDATLENDEHELLVGHINLIR